jgi:hypothetical protein
MDAGVHVNTAEALVCKATEKTEGCSVLLVLGMLVGSTKVLGIPDDMLAQMRAGHAPEDRCCTHC